jgi:hypothetical protein
VFETGRLEVTAANCEAGSTAASCGGGVDAPRRAFWTGKKP